MENRRTRRQPAHSDKRRSTFKEPCWLREPDLNQGPVVKRPCRERRENIGHSENMERKARDIRHRRVLAPSQQSNDCPGRQEHSEWKRTVCHRSPGAQVKVAAVVKTSLTTCTTPKPAPRKRRKIHPSGFRGKGQLKLTVTPDNGLLHIQILEARGLLGRECRPCDSYVKITLVPDVDHSSRQKTRTVINCKSPVFNESFVIDVGEDKQLKRLLVTAWNRSRTSRRSEFLGCMSFGVHSLITSAKEIRGWYYLLGEELGRNKHLRVATRRAKQSDKAALTNHAAGPDITSPENMQSLTVTILRGKDGFGFTICSDSPVRVQAVDPGGPAHQAGLQQLDTVLQLNGQPVEHWKCVDLAHAIRNCRNEITVVVWRTMPVMKPYYEGLIHRPSYKTSGFDSMSPATKTQNKTPPLLSRPSNHKLSRRKKGNSSESAGNGTREPTWSWTGKREENDYKTRTQTLKGTRVTSSNGDNYIILSPGNQILQPVYPDSNGTLGTLGRIYQTHSSQGIQQSTAYLQDTGVEARATLRRSLNSKTATIPPSSYRQSFANYQNCTLVQSHLPHSSYGTYVSLAPKILIFPVFVQPLDLCSPERTLLLSEEMILHDSTNMALKATVFIYTDLMLLTREDEPGRCNVLQSPLYLHQIQLQDVPADKLRLYISYRVERTECLFSLEAFSAEQKRRVYQCLRDNINKQLTLRERMGPDQMLEPKAGDQADLGLLGFGAHSVSEPCSPSQPTCSPLSGLTRARTSIPSECVSYPSECVQPPPTLGDTSKSAHMEPAAIWKERVKEPRRGEREPEFEKREQGEGESARPTSSSSSSSPLIIPKLCLDRSFNPDVLTSPSTDDDDEDLEEEEEEEEDSDEGYLKRRSLVEMSPGRGQQSTRLCVQRSLHRRTHSEGSLLQEPRSPRFISDQAIHCMESSREMQQRWTVPSPQTLRKELTKNRGSVHQICLLFTGRRVCGEPNCKCQMGKSAMKKKKSKNLAKDMKNRLTFLRKKNNDRPGSHPSSKLEKVLKSDKPSPEEALKWGESFDQLLSHKYGLAVFRSFLQSEFSEENLDFWLACEDYRRIKSLSKMASRAKKIFEQYISIQSSKEVNLDSYTREQTKENMESVGADCFDLAQSRIFGLMEKDPYPRFLRSDLYLDLTHQKRAPLQSFLKAADSDC
ncbi:regulator of G-protein signaling 3 isoform X1 [Pangasianodon hypophthalmus]|uniref:regulator of G-protein signaling 3 isoform X1 n=2 Tax=Pangasianodon hypophthalmus TaxID=310915 RepID=UPI0023071679|nr:regulator of G-protein signaling 3 isoform X1 [Pangasianodon hypophthalmus]